MRYPSIDILRTFAIFVMVLVHFGENLSGFHSPITGFGAPLFAFLSGVSYCIWSRELRARGKSEQEISKISVRRGLFVFGVGFAFNILVWLPEDTFNWDVLTFVGAALLLLNFVRRMPLPVVVLAATMAVLVSPILRELADYQAYWTNLYYEGDLTLSDITIGFLATGYFPVFPWIAFSLAGFVAGSLLFAKRSSAIDKSAAGPATGTAIEAKVVWRVAGLGFALIATSLALLAVHDRLPDIMAKKLLGGWTMFPPTMEYVFCTLGMALALLALGHRFVDGNPRVLRRAGLLNIAKTFSRYSFTIYIVHHMAHIWPLWWAAMWNGEEPTAYWMKAMPIGSSLALAALFLVVCYFVLRKLGPNRAYGIESWMRWLCD